MVAARVLPLEEEIQIETELVVVVGKEECSLDAAIDRLAEIQLAMRALKKEEKPLRKAAAQALRVCGLKKHVTATGHSATLYSQGRVKVDLQRLKEILTPAQFAEVVSTPTSHGMRVR